MYENGYVKTLDKSTNMVYHNTVDHVGRFAYL